MRNKWDILVKNLNTAIDSIKSSLGELLQSYIDFYDAKIDKQQENVEYLSNSDFLFFYLLIPPFVFVSINDNCFAKLSSYCKKYHLLILCLCLKTSFE